MQMTFFFIFPRKQILTFHANCILKFHANCHLREILGDNLHEISKSVFWDKYFKISSAEIFTQHAKGIKAYYHVNEPL